MSNNMYDNFDSFIFTAAIFNSEIYDILFNIFLKSNYSEPNKCTIKVDSMFEHESTNGKTYEIAYEVTLLAEFHSPFTSLNTAVPADA